MFTIWWIETVSWASLVLTKEKFENIFHYTNCDAGKLIMKVYFEIKFPFKIENKNENS